MMNFFPLQYENGSFLMEAEIKSKKGQQLWINYGKHGNYELLLHYGFIIDENRHNHVQIFSDIDEIVDFYMENMSHSNFSEPGSLKQAAERAILSFEEWESQFQADMASVAYSEFKPNSGPENERVEGSGFSVWPNGRIEPRLLAAMFALSAYEINSNGKSAKKAKLSFLPGK